MSEFKKAMTYMKTIIFDGEFCDESCHCFIPRGHWVSCDFIWGRNTMNADKSWNHALKLEQEFRKKWIRCDECHTAEKQSAK